MSYRDSRPWERKFRGARRYYRALHRRATDFTLDFDAASWFDLYHTHFDWVGHGRRGQKHRRQHLVELFVAFRRVMEQARESGRPVQVWVEVEVDTEPEQDALYVHSANPNGTPFPYGFDHVTWNVDVPAILRGLLEPSWEVGTSTLEGRPRYTVRQRTAASTP